MMLRAGHLDKNQLQAVQARAAEGKMSFVAAIIELGFVEENSIVAFLHSKLMIPKVGADALESIDAETRTKVSAELARKHVVLPVGTDNAGNLTLAMSDPTDMKAVDAISGHTGAYLVRAVAPHRSLLAAIERCYPIEEAKPAAPEPAPAPAPAKTAAPQVAAPQVAAPSVAAPSVAAPPVAAPPVAAPPVAAPPVAAPPVAAPPVAAPPVAAPPVAAPPVAAPPVAAPPVAAPPIAAPPVAAPPVAAPPVAAPPVAAPSVAAPPVAAPSVAAPSVAAPSVAAPPVAAPPVAAPPVAAPPVAAPPVAAPPVAAPPVAAPPVAAPPIAAPSSAADNGIAPPPEWAGAREQEGETPAAARANATPLSFEALSLLIPRFATLRSRNQLTDLLLDFLADGFVRVIMFVHSKGEIRGHDARGEDLMIEAVRQIRIPATGPSLFSDVIGQQQPFVGPMPTATAIDTAFNAALGGVEGRILVLPLALRGRVPVIVFAATARFEVAQRVVDQLAFQASAALERLIVAAKRG